MKVKNKIIILENNGGRLANHLWQYAVIYAYCLEEGFEIENYSFFRYQEYFNLPSPNNKIIYFLFFRLYYFHRNIKINKLLYSLFLGIMKLLHNGRVVSPKKIIFLPPSENKDMSTELKIVDSGIGDNFYFCGWNFRNPDGLKKYHQEICQYFSPKGEVLERVKIFINKLRREAKKIVGIHVRHGDYRIFSGGKYYFSFAEVRITIDDFLASQDHPEDIVFVVCSDDKIDKDALQGLNYREGMGSPMADLYTLAAVDLLISSVSTFSQWASYYGDINNINFSKENINWKDCFMKKNENNPWLI